MSDTPIARLMEVKLALHECAANAGSNGAVFDAATRGIMSLVEIERELAALNKPQIPDAPDGYRYELVLSTPKTVHIIDGAPLRECDCDQSSELCQRFGHKRALMTCGFARCFVPASQSESVALNAATGTGEVMTSRLEVTCGICGGDNHIEHACPKGVGPKVAIDYALVSVVDESPFVDEALWEKGDEGYELVSAYPLDGCVKLYFKRPT